MSNNNNNDNNDNNNNNNNYNNNNNNNNNDINNNNNNNNSNNSVSLLRLTLQTTNSYLPHRKFDLKEKGLAATQTHLYVLKRIIFAELLKFNNTNPFPIFLVKVKTYLSVAAHQGQN